MEAANERDEGYKRQLQELETDLERHKLSAEVDIFRAVEKVWEQERQHLHEWAEDIKERHRVEKKALEERVANLEAEKASGARSPTSASPGGDGIALTPSTTAGALISSSAGSAATTAVTSGPATSGDSTTSPLISLATTATTTTSTPTTPITTHSTAATHTSVSGASAPVTVTSGGADTTVTSAMTGPEMITRLFEAQTQLFAAQVHAATLPPLANFKGQNAADDDDGFERWLEKFEERAKLAKWTDEVKLCQLKLHLVDTADQVFRALNSEQKSSYPAAVTALKKRFRPIAIEELRGWDFHRRVQGDESVEQLGMDLQKLGHKAFPSLEGRDFDRMMKGRFFQALHTRWQRKLGAPRPEETFSQLFERARMFEQHEKQYSEAAASRSDQRPKKAGSSKPVPNSTQDSRPPKQVKPVDASVQPSVQKPRLCHVCQQPGHLARHCPDRNKKEALGRSTKTVSRTSCLAAEESKSCDDLSDEQLESILAQRRLHKERQLLTKSGNSDVNCIVPTEGVTGKAVGPSLYFDIDIEGVRVTAMVDSGSPTTIISRSLLHRIANKLRSDSKPIPELLPPSVRLYGKDGPKGGPELLVTAETNLTLMADGKTVLIPVFIQPDSSQACLLGMNAAQPLGLLFLDSKGKPLRTTSEHLHGSESVLEQKSACVSLIHATTIPSHGGRFLKAQVGGDCRPGDQLIFEPQKDNLEPMGLSGIDSILTVHEEGTVLIPVQNFCESKVIIPDGVELGRVEPFDESAVNASLPPHSMTDESACAKVVVNGLGYHEPERPPRLLGKLDLSQCDCNPEQLEDLKVLLSQHADVFALDPSELGCCGMVQRTIDTGDMPPIKQQPYRTPVIK